VSGLLVSMVLVILLFAVLAISNWRIAMLATIALGFAQDPLRKMIEGQPVQAVVLCVVGLILAMLGAMIRVGGVSLAPMTGGSARTRNVLRLFVILVMVQAVFAFLRFKSIMIPAIGMLAYLTPIPALWLSYSYVRELTDVRRFLYVYVVLGLIASLGIIASAAGIESQVLSTIGGDMLIFDRVAGIVEAHSGLMRSPEIGAWHAAAVACLVIVLRVSFPTILVRLMTPAVVLVCLYAAMMTGRRKVLAICMLFAATYFLGLRYFGKSGHRHGMIVATLIGVLVVAGAVIMAPDPSQMSSYALRSSTVLVDAWERLAILGGTTIGWALEVGGPFGMGTGAGAQGTQNFGTGMIAAGGAAEGGLGKITVELGLLGLVLAVLSAWLVARQVKRCIALAAKSDPNLLKVSLGLISFVAANVPVFVGASQVYGDPFVLILLSSMLGFVLAVPRILRLREMRELRFRQAQRVNLPWAAQHPELHSIDRRPRAP
jgi:hypothetical protein